MMMAPLPQTTMFTGTEWTVIAVSYLLGSISCGYYWVRWRTGRDIRQLGSGNTGARNVGRMLGPTGFLVTLLGDVAKGALAIDLAGFLGVGPDATIAVMLAVVAGHTWPWQLRFRGGKGVATSLGALLAYDPLLALVLLALFLPAWMVVRSFTLAGLVAFGLSPLVIFLWGLGYREVAAMSLLAILVHVTHRQNIRDELGRRFPAPLPKTNESEDKSQPS